MAHELKFKVGDRVRVVGDELYAGHARDVGKVYTIKEAVKESRQGLFPCNYQEYLLSGDEGYAWATENDIEAVE